MDLQALISFIFAIITFFTSFSGMFGSGRTYTVKVEAPEKAGYDWTCAIDDTNIIKMNSGTVVQGTAGMETCEFVLGAVANSYGCARATFTYTNGTPGGYSEAYTFKVSGVPFIGQFSLLMTEKNPEGAAAPKTNAEILAAYSSVMNSAKLTVKTFTEKVYTDVDWLITANSTGATFRPGTNVLEDNGMRTSALAYLPIAAGMGCALTDASKIKSASYENLTDGNVRLTISLFDEPEGQQYIHQMFNVPMSSLFKLPAAALAFNIKNASCKYFDCKAILVYNPATNRIVSLEQIIGYAITGTVTYSDLDCTIVGRPVDHEKYENFTF